MCMRMDHRVRVDKAGGRRNHLGSVGEQVKLTINKVIKGVMNTQGQGKKG